MAKSTKSRKKKRPVAVTSLPTIRPLVAGIDVGSTEHWVCGPARADGAPNVRVFRTTTPQLEELVDWLVEQGVQSVASRTGGRMIDFSSGGREGWCGGSHHDGVEGNTARRPSTSQRLPGRGRPVGATPSSPPG